MPDQAPLRRPGFTSASFSFSVPDPIATAASMSSGTVMAFDYGTERIGVAVGDVGEIASGNAPMAHPLTTLRGGTTDARFDAIGRLVSEWKPTRLLVGLPLHMDGTEHEMTARARRFARRLEGRFGIAVELVDERLTTRDAAARLSEAGVSARRQRPVRDQVAAQTILETWLAERER